MKRCPQCEFIYEDDQSLCDMDGILLVFDSQQLPKTSTASTKSQWRNRLFPAAAALVLATVFLLVYYVSTTKRPSSISKPTTSSEVMNNTTQGSNTENTSSAPASEAKESDSNKAKPVTVPAATPKETPKKPKEIRKSTVSSSPQTREDSSPQTREDSKIGSFMKKTGRILKKPFKF
jgi:hypothetical protein